MNVYEYGHVYVIVCMRMCVLCKRVCMVMYT